MPLREVNGPETPQEHVRTALMLLAEVERGIRDLDMLLTTEQAATIYEPLDAARGRLWLAVTQLERGGTPP